MEIKSSNVYVSLFELPLEVHFLYWLGGTFALHEPGAWSPTAEELTAALACIWDGAQFTLADAVDFPLMSNGR
jgi:hypothetical protein